MNILDFDAQWPDLTEDFHAPLPGHDPHWTAMIYGTGAIVWACGIVAWWCA